MFPPVQLPADQNHRSSFFVFTIFCSFRSAQGYNQHLLVLCRLSVCLSVRHCPFSPSGTSPRCRLTRHHISSQDSWRMWRRVQSHSLQFPDLTFSLSSAGSGFGISQSSRLSSSVSAMRVLNTGSDVEEALADALVQKHRNPEYQHL